MTPAIEDQQSSARTARRGLSAVLILLLSLALSGCGVRLETPPPTEPTPDALEVARRAAVSDVLAILEVSAQVSDADDLKKPVAKLVTTIHAASLSHLEQLGGEYDSGLDPEETLGTYSTKGSAQENKPSRNADGDMEPTASLDEVVDRLAQAYSRTRGALESAPDSGLARLMASIATFQLTSAQSLASSADLELPKINVPGTPEMPSEPPVGIASSDLIPIILAEDGAGYAYEVLAAQLSDAPRVAALARATIHRSRADAAATAAQVARTVQDPRRVAYELPTDPADETYVRGLELSLAQAYAALIGLAVEEERVRFFDLMIDSYHAGQTWGAKPLVFPGLPEQQGK